jgi:hypothetical protein
MNNKLFLILAVFLITISSVSATCFGNVEVHVVDNNGADLSGVVVAPEVKYSIGGWNDAVPKTDVTNFEGIARECSWIVFSGAKLQINYATLEGYTCTSKLDTRITATSGKNMLNVICNPTNEVPEFGVVAGSLALLAGIGIVAFRRK